MNVKHMRDRTLSPVMREKQKHRGSSHIVETREIYDNEDAIESRTGLQRDHEAQEASRELAMAALEDTNPPPPAIGQAVTTTTATHQQHSRGIPGTKAASGAPIARKNLPHPSSSRNSVPNPPSSRVHSPPPLTHTAQHQNQNQPENSRSSSRVSGTLRGGPVPDLYAYAGVAIENEEELERLEEEERRIDEAIRESESRAQMRVEQEDIRVRIRGLRDSM